MTSNPVDILKVSTVTNPKAILETYREHCYMVVMYLTIDYQNISVFSDCVQFIDIPSCQYFNLMNKWYNLET